ncbi:MAG TPA: TonB-dependent receptor [Caldimonas sp.]|nr:TonB-dependent receptor [Caldimonas sp.]HEX4235925.1 TonB-dependent receptor [Caldimonas sp.]
MLKKTKLCTGLMVACGGVLLSAGQTSFAQDSGSAQTLERVTVTGSNIKRTDTETASPVQILTRQDIEKTGKQSIQEVLRQVTADGQGSIPSSFSNGFASGSAAVSLRGLGVNSTLVLVNGRRMTTYGLADDGTRNFVDINSIPLEAVDRVEVLKDGASAIYGADAVGGVVNIILRKNYNGASIGGTYGQSSRSDGQATRGFATYGAGNLDTDKWNAFVSVEASHQNNIWSKDRGFLGQTDLTSKGFYDTTNGANRPYFGLGPTANSPYGVIRNPVGNVRTNVVPCDPSLIDPTTHLCRYDGLVEQEIQPEIQRFNIFGRGQLVFNPSLSAYLELGLFQRKTSANGTLGANNDGGVFNPADPLNPVIVHGLMNLPAGHPDNPFGVNRAVGVRPNELGGRDQVTDNAVFRAVEGLQGTAWGWDFDVGAAYIKSRLENTNTGFIRYDVMQNALNNGTYRFAGLGASATDPAVLAAISPALRTTPTSSIKLIDAKVSRELMNLQGGPLGLALGAEMRWEAADNPAVPFTTDSEIVGLGYSQFSSSRKVTAFYGELTAPVMKWLELNGALRYDHYSDFGDSWTPKVGFKVKPIDTLAIRGTYSEAFRAPGPAEVGGSSFGFTSVGILSIGQPGIKPETAKSYTLGLIFEPIVGSSVTLDWWKIDRKNEIVQADPAAIITPGTPLTGQTPLSKIPGAIPNSFIYYDAAGDLATVSGNYTNASATNTSGIDVELRGKMRLQEAGNLTGILTWTHTSTYKRTDAQGNTTDYVGTQGPIVLSAGAGTPKDRASFSLTWDRGPFAVTGQVNYIASLKLVDHNGEQVTPNADGTVTDNTNGLVYANNGDLNCASFDTAGNPYGGCKLPSFTTFDLFGKWNPTKNWEVNASIQNLFDTKAPFDPYLVLTYGINYNQTWHQSGAIGRFFTIGAKYTF